MNTELDNLLSKILKAGQIKIENGQLLVSPIALAKKYGDQIRRLKPEILLHFGYCPVCAGELVATVETFRETGRARRYSRCQTQMHYDKWEN